MPTLTPLSTILSRMNRWQAIEQVEEQYKVRDLDTAIRELRRKTLFPWALRQGTLRVFQDVLIYPVASDHDELAFFDNDAKQYSLKPRTRFTSLKEFLENPDSRNDLTEVWDQGTRMIGLRYRTRNATSQLINNAETASDFSVAGDATAVVKDEVVFKEGNASMRISITNSAGTATITNTITSISDSNYKRKYHFKWIYLDAVPTSIELRLRSSAGNYLSTTVTTQFSGQAFKADAWNLVAHDLNIATEVGTFDSTAISSEQIVLTGAATGTYYIDSSHLRAWELLDYWYYSKNIVATDGSSVADQSFFFNSSETYSTDSNLVCDEEWVDVFMYSALKDTVADEEDGNLFGLFSGKLTEVMQELVEQYPHLRPHQVTQYHSFVSEHMEQFYNSYYEEI